MNKTIRFCSPVLLLCTLFGCVLLSTGSAQEAATGVGDPVFESTMKLMGKMVGGTWVTTGNFKAEMTYTWRIPGKALRGIGRAAIGTPQEFSIESLYGWDGAAKKVYYLDFHGHDTIYKGLVTADGDKLNGDFEGMTGDNGKYRFSDEIKPDGTLESSMFGKTKEGQWVKIHSMTWKRKS